MRAPTANDVPTISRRALLMGGGALGAGATVGWLGGDPGMDETPSESVSLSIKTVPADADEPATRIARSLATNLQAVGVDANVVLKPTKELRRDVLQRDAFDLYVDRLPLAPDPDTLRSLLHSESRGRVGWHNPFGYAHPEIDRLLDRQRRTSGTERRKTIADILRRIAAEQPLLAVAVPNAIGIVRTDRYENWQGKPIHSPRRYLGVRRGEDPGTERLVLGVTDDRITRNLNPLSAQYRSQGTVTGLLYDPLGRRVAGELRPWLAREWSWIEGDPRRIEVTLRADLRWHDGTPLDAADVDFTYRFLEDTSLGRADASVPAPRLHDRASLVDRVAKLDRNTIRMDFGDTPAPVAHRALTTPILPRHVWEQRAVQTDSRGTEVNDTVTKAIQWQNPEPIGSGPLQIRNRTVGDALVLDRFDDHFSNSGARAEQPLPPVAFDSLHLQVLPSPTAAVELAENGDIDATLGLKDPGVVPDIGRTAPLTLTVSRAPVLYHVGFNSRRDPVGDPDVRRTIARLLDKAHVVETIFDGYASPVATPFADTSWVPPELAWEDGDPEVPFLGVDGRLDVERARERIRSIGYQYESGMVVPR